MASKYAHLKLPRIVSTEPSKQTKVDYKINEFLVNLGIKPTSAILAAAYAEVRRRKNALKEQLSALEVEVEAIKQLLVEQFESEDMSSLKLGNGDAVRIQIEPYLVVEVPAKFRKWCVANGFEQSLQLPWSTANSMVKGLLLRGKPEPDGTSAYMLSKAVFSPGGSSHDTEDDES
jgi:hypothetical protein